MRIIISVACLWLATSPLYGKIVFYSARDGNNEIYTMDADGSNQTRLTFNEASDAYPVWSPDGRQIVFHSNRDGNNEIYVMDADGRNQRNVTNHPASDSFADWSPDGSRIIFSSKRKVEGIRPINLFMMDSDGTDVKPLAHRGGWQEPQVVAGRDTNRFRLYLYNQRQWQKYSAGSKTPTGRQSDGS